MKPKTTAKTWIESRWQVSQNHIESLQTQMEQFGCLGSYQMTDLTQDGPHEGNEVELLAYFPDQASLKDFAKKLQPLENDNTKLTIIKSIPQGDWATAWKKYFKPFALTQNIIIKPSWEEYQSKPDDLVITLDPGMAFGTGQHDTTRFCAELICELKQKNVNLQSLLDIGCGSGILSLIARKVGYADVSGIDNDAASIEASHENLERNPDLAPIHFYRTSGRLYHQGLKPAEVVVSNIIAEVLCEFKDDLIALMTQDGYLVLSGIMPERAALIEGTFKDLNLVEKRASKDWHAYVYTQK